MFLMTLVCAKQQRRHLLRQGCDVANGKKKKRNFSGGAHLGHLGFKFWNFLSKYFCLVLFWTDLWYRIRFKWLGIFWKFHYLLDIGFVGWPWVFLWLKIMLLELL